MISEEFKVMYKGVEVIDIIHLIKNDFFLPEAKIKNFEVDLLLLIGTQLRTFKNLRKSQRFIGKLHTR